MRVLAAVVVAVVVSVVAPPAAAQDCGGDNPQWLLVTLIEHRMFIGSEWRNTIRGHPAVLKICDIKEIGVNGNGDTLISFKSFVPDENAHLLYWWVLETPKEICEALPTCSDATGVLTDDAPRDR